jgi:hypothetical protein
MPSQRHSGQRGVSWGVCDRCKWDYPHDQLVMQNGLLLCVTKCVDNPDMVLPSQREREINDVLRLKQEEPFNVTARKRRLPNLIRR